MKFVVLACLFAIAAAAPQQEIHVLRDDRDVRPDGYSFNYETSDGVSRNEQGAPVQGDSGALGQTGEISFTFPNGEVFTLRFVADEFGYRPESPFIPTIAGKKK